MTIAEWKATQEERDSIRLCEMANAKPITGQTVTPVTETITRPPELVAKEQAHIYLMSLLGLPPSGSNEQIESALLAMKATDFAGAAKISVQLLNVRVYLGDFREATGMGRASTYTDPHFGQASYTVTHDEITYQYGPSVAEANGWGVVTVEMIEAAK